MGIDSHTLQHRRDTVERLRREEADAWHEYLETTRHQSVFRYDELEPWAWKRLQARVTAIRARRRAIA